MHNIKERLLGDVPISELAQVGPKLTGYYHKLQIYTVKDLLLHFPYRYEDKSTATDIAQLKPNQLTTVIGKIVQVHFSDHKKKHLLCRVQQGNAFLTLRFIHFSAFIHQQLVVGAFIKSYGEVKQNSFGSEMLHPQFEVAHDAQELYARLPKTHTPIYSSTAGLSQFQIRKQIHQALTLMWQHKNDHDEYLPETLARYFPSLEQSITFLHYPELSADLEQIKNGQHRAVKRLIAEELLAYLFAMNQIKTNETFAATPLVDKKKYRSPFLKRLPFKPTRAQQRVTKEIDADLKQDRVMLRLVQGDVGSGKTLVAALAALRTLENKKQVALMAPTEILAEQHFANFKLWFEPLGLKVGLLTGKKTAKQKKIIYQQLTEGKIDLIIGTHALFVDQVQFKQLGLVIIDEQHRFGVNQRLSLWNKGQSAAMAPHQLIMTATPIPRTLAMSIYADLKISTIDELPPNRKPIMTSLLSNNQRDQLIHRIGIAIQEGKQVYWVCPLVEDSEMLDAKSAEENYEELKKCLPQANIGLIHGKMKPAEKEIAMRDFKSNRTQLLVATSVIEVGVDVPNASIMIIENAERFGLSQLHQLRGRVGRGQNESFCILMYRSPLSKIAKQRLEIMAETQDGFLIAERDFEIRGAGDILGTRQIGTAEFKLVDLARDQAMLEKIALHVNETNQARLEKLSKFWLENKNKYIHA